MEDKTQTPQTQVQPPAQNVQPNPPSITLESKGDEGNNKLMFWLIGGLVVVILVVGGIYFYLSGQQKPTTPTPTIPPVSRVETVDSLENELNALDVGDLDQEFSVVDKDLQNL